MGPITLAGERHALACSPTHTPGAAISEQRDYHPADRLAIAVSVLIAAVAASILYFLPDALERAESSLTASVTLLISISATMAFSALLAACWLWRVSNRARREVRFPPQQMRLPIRTRVRRGADALRQARACRGGALILVAIAGCWLVPIAIIGRLA